MKWNDIPHELWVNYLERHRLAHGIAWVLAQRATGPSDGLLSQQARERAEARFAAPVVAAQYWGVYANVVM